MSTLKSKLQQQTKGQKLKNQRVKSVLLIGGLGHLGRQLESKLTLTNNNVTILDREAQINSYLETSQKNADENPIEAIFFKGDNFFSSGPFSKTIDVPKFDSVVICVRTRESQENMLPVNPFTVESIAAMEENFRSTVIEPLIIIEKLIGGEERKSAPTSLIFIYSSNANQVSHQSLGYHVINSAIQNLAQYLSVSLRKEKISTYAIELGVIDFEKDSMDQQQSSKAFPGVAIDEISQVLDFIIDINPLSLTGKSISMTGGRSLLDSTAVAEQVFGDLKVRVIK